MESRSDMVLVLGIFATNVDLVLDEELATTALAVDEAIEADRFSAAIAEMLELRVVSVECGRFLRCDFFLSECFAHSFCLNLSKTGIRPARESNRTAYWF
jgi:hypothetical protein